MQQQSLPYVNGRFECNNLELRRLEADYEAIIDLSGYNNRPSWVFKKQKIKRHYYGWKITPLTVELGQHISHPNR